MKKLPLLLLWATMLCLAGCWSSYNLDIQSDDITWKPNLKADMQVISFNENNGDMVFQEISKNEDDDNLDTLVIASDDELPKTTDASLSSYVQTSINHLKLIWWYDLSKEKSKKTSVVWEGANVYPAILKTFNIVSDETELSVAQFYIEKNKTVFMLSYASSDSSHTKKFVNELSSLKMN